MRAREFAEKKERLGAVNPRSAAGLIKLRAQYPDANSDLEALMIDYGSSQKQDRRDISRLDQENDSEEKQIDQLDRENDSDADRLDQLEKEIIILKNKLLEK